MDYRRVAKEFQRCACVMQAAILGCLAVYAVHGVHEIIDQMASPPVQSHYVHWGNPGKFMVCASPGNELWGICTALPRAESKGFGDPGEFRAWTGQTSSVRVVEVQGDEQNCSIVDLTLWAMPDPPVSFGISYDGPLAGTLYAWNGVEWHKIWYKNSHSVARISFAKKRHGQDFGYRSTYYDVFQNLIELSWRGTHHNHSEYCAGQWKRFRPSSGGESAFILTIQDPLVETTAMQGVLPQALTLIGNLGGYLSLSVAVFTFIWVRRYPHSDVANTYEECTLIGYEDVDVEPARTVANEEMGSQVQPPVSTEGSSSSGARTSTLVGKPAPAIGGPSRGERDPLRMRASE